MKLFLAVVLLLCALMTSARAQQEADDKYIVIYNLIQQADTLVDNGQSRDALAAYLDAQTRLQGFQKLFPDWDVGTVDYRLNDLADKIARLQAQMPAKKNEPPAAAITSVDKAMPVDPQVNILQSQLQMAQDENERLQAKLKEALATQPAMMDAGELANAQAQLRSLMKENALLKAVMSGQASAPAPVTNPGTAGISQLRSQLAGDVKKLTAETARADKLAGENSRLQSQLAALPPAANNAGVADELSNKLADARAQVAALQSAMAQAALEKSALKNKVQHLASELADSAASSQARIRDLTDERDDLRQKLAVAKAKDSRNQVTDDTAQVAALNNEVATLQARVDVDEAKPVPFSDEELALLKPVTPVTPVAVVKNPIVRLPAGTQDLVASAQRHFSSHEYAAAAADYEKILQRDPNNPLTLGNLAMVEMSVGELADAEKHIQAALTQSPDDAYDLFTLGSIKLQQGKYDDALAALSRAAKSDPQNPDIQNNIGLVLAHKGLSAQAETAFRKSIQLDPNYADAHDNLATLYLSQNPPLPQLARWHYQKALAAGQPRNPDLEKMLAGKGAPVSAPQ